MSRRGTMKTKDIILCAVFAAIMCVFSVMTIPTGVVYVSMSFFGIMLGAGVLGLKRGTIATVVFILIGAVGLPVFSGFRGGISMLLGPTGGYIWTYVFLAASVGVFTIRAPQNKWLAMAKMFAGCLVGIALCYTGGTLQFMLVQAVDLKAALAACVIPFLPFELVKALAASYLSYVIKRALIKAQIME